MVFVAVTESAGLSGVQHDAVAMREVAAGQASTFNALYRAHHQAVFRLAWGVLLDEAEARDVVQETFAALHAAARRWEPRATVFTFLTRVALHRSLSLRRRFLRRWWVPPAPSVPLDSQVAHAQLRRALGEALRGLSARDRALVVLHLEHELDPAEMAPLLTLTPNATRVALHRALTRVRAALLAKGFDPEPIPSLVQQEPT